MPSAHELVYMVVDLVVKKEGIRGLAEEQLQGSFVFKKRKKKKKSDGNDIVVPLGWLNLSV